MPGATSEGAGVDEADGVAVSAGVAVGAGVGAPPTPPGARSLRKTRPAPTMTTRATAMTAARALGGAVGTVLEPVGHGALELSVAHATCPSRVVAWARPSSKEARRARV